jgi:uncharacterized membrane-anchored protein YitT (DUF2179 family)
MSTIGWLRRFSFHSAGLKRVSADLALIGAGAFITAISINTFIIPYHLLTGGVTGLAIILNYLFKVPVSLMILLINIPIFWWGYREINRRFLLYSLAGTFALSALLAMTKNLVPAPQIDLIMAAVFGGALGGAGLGLIFRAGGSTGGADIVAVVLKKRKNLGLGEVTFYSNLLVIAVSLFFFPVNTGLYTIISMFVLGKTVDSVITGLNTNKSVIIISDQAAQISDQIIRELHRGVTFFAGHGAYSNTQKTVINCVINRFELARLKDIVVKIDPGAFMYVSDASEVLGKGFARW